MSSRNVTKTTLVTCKIIPMIPIYPKEIDIRDLAEASGWSYEVVAKTLRGLPAECPVAEDETKYTFLSAKDRDAWLAGYMSKKSEAV